MTAVALTPLRPILADHGIAQSEFARAMGMSTIAACRLVAHGQWPARRAAELRQRAVTFFKDRGVGMAHLRALVLPAITVQRKEVGPAGLHPDEATPEAQKPTETPEEEQMLLRNETLTPAARKHFGLPRNPFVDDIQSRDDVFASQNGRYVRAALLDAATNHGFIAVLGESGSGKSTLREDLEERIRDERRPIVVIKPYIQGLEPSEAKGKPLRSGHIAEAIVDALAPGVSLKSSAQARYKQVHELLKASRQAGYTHLLVIEEAHRLPVATLKHLKNFIELKDGLRRLLGVALLGQTRELAALLDERNPEVREIVQRCEQIVMEPLDNDLEAYLVHKFERSGSKLTDVLNPDALDAIRARLISTPRGGRPSDAVSVCYPLVVNNLVCRALNAAALSGWPKVDAEVIAGC